MDNALIFLEPSQNARRSYIGLIEKLIRFFEFILLKYQLKRITKNSQVKIYSQDSNESSSLNKKGIKTILIENIHLSEDQIEESKNFSISVAKKWYNQNYSHLLDYKGINLGKSTEQETIQIIDQLFKKFLIYESIIKKNVAKTVQVENPYSPDGKAIKLICEDLGLKFIPLHPMLYGKLKIWFINKFKYNNYRKNTVDLIKLYNIQTLSKFDENVKDNFREDKIKILLDVPYPTHLDITSPTIQKFISKGYKIYLLARSNDILKYKSKFSFMSYKLKKIHYTDLKVKIDNYFSILEKNHDNIFNYGNIDLWELIKDDLYLSHKNKLPAILFQLKNFINIVELIKPNLLIVGDDRGPSSVRIDILYCKEKGIPHFEIQHGMYTSQSLMTTPISDKIFIWGEAAKDSLIEAGATNEQIKVTGSPKYDSLILRSDNYNRSLVKTDDKIILFTTQPLPGNTNLQIINEIGLFLNKNKGISLIVKPHPAEIKDYYKGFVEQFSGDIISIADSDEDTTDLILRADIIIILSSTVGIEAAILDKPLICVNLSKEKSLYVESGVALEVNDLKELEPQINNILYNHKIQKDLKECREKFIYEYAYLQDGKASERIVNEIVKVIENKAIN